MASKLKQKKSICYECTKLRHRHPPTCLSTDSATQCNASRRVGTRCTDARGAFNLSPAISLPLLPGKARLELPSTPNWRREWAIVACGGSARIQAQKVDKLQLHRDMRHENCEGWGGIVAGRGSGGDCEVRRLALPRGLPIHSHCRILVNVFKFFVVSLRHLFFVQLRRSPSIVVVSCRVRRKSYSIATFTPLLLLLF